MKVTRILIAAVAIDALVMALGHAPFALGLSILFRPAGRQPPRPPSGGPPAGGLAFFPAIGAYFLVFTVLYILGAILLATGKFYRSTTWGFAAMSVIDNLLLIYTRTMPNIFFGRMLPWSWTLFPVGTVEVLLGQLIITILCVILLYKPKP